MHRRQVLARVGVGVSSLAAGCGSLGSTRETDQVTVNPAVDGTPTTGDDGASDDEETAIPAADWRVELSSTESHVGLYGDTAVVAEVLSGRTRVRGFDSETGRKTYVRRFETELDPAHYGLEKHQYGSAVVELDGPSVVLLDATTGETVWSIDRPGAVVFEEPGTRYVFLGDEGWNTVVVLDAENWTERCRFPVPTDFLGYGRGFVLRQAADENATEGTATDETASLGDSGVVCHSTDDGSRLWTKTVDFDVDQMTSARVGESVFFTDGLTLSSYDLADGTRQFTADPDVPLGLPWAVDDGVAYFGNVNGAGDTGRIFAFDEQDGELWRQTFDGATAYPLLRGGQLYGLVDGERQEKTVALESGTGRVRWSHHGEFHGLAKDGGIYMGRGSRIARIAADGSVVWQSALGIRQPSEREFWRQYGDSFLAWTRAAFVTLDASTGETRRRIEGLDTLDGPARSYAAGSSDDDRVLLDFRDHVSAVRL